MTFRFLVTSIPDGVVSKFTACHVLQDSPLSINLEPMTMTGKGVGKGASNWLRLKRIYSKTVLRLSGSTGEW